MALIKRDRNQTKTAGALIGVLVVVIGVTAVRLKPQAAPQAPAQPQPTGTKAAPVKRGPEPSFGASRNPFERPAELADASSVDGPGGDAEALPGTAAGANPGPNPYRTGGKATVQPADPAAAYQVKSPSKKAAPTKDSYDPQQVKPEFRLLATLRCGDSYSAVIGTGQSSARVVEVDDVLEGHFRVLMIDGDRAVLSDGRQMIVAKRPKS